MTDEMPTKIYAHMGEDFGEYRVAGWYYNPAHSPVKTTEYIRADIAQARIAELEAQLRAALRPRTIDANIHGSLSVDVQNSLKRR